jgi:hypothetical protein
VNVNRDDPTAVAPNQKGVTDLVREHEQREPE